MLLNVTTTQRPATDLGYLLVKHPDKVHSFDVPTGTAHVLFPDAAEDRCTAALLLDVDPQRLGAARGGRKQQSAPESFALGQYVNDRPYAASSLLAGALAKVFRSALRGESKDRPGLAEEAIPLEIHVPVLRCRGSAVALFEPLGWAVVATPIPLAWAPQTNTRKPSPSWMIPSPNLTGVEGSAPRRARRCHPAAKIGPSRIR